MQNAVVNWHDIYQQVEYLESSGTQYITTEIIPKILSNADSFYVDFSILTNNTVLVFGVRDTGFQLPSVTGYHLRADMVTGGTTKFFGYTSNGEKCSFKIENQAATCLGVSYEGAYFNYNNPLTLFGKGNEVSTLLIGRIYYCSYTYNNVKQAELFPCYRKADNKPGMYDTVNGIFYTNEGTSEFIIPTIGG